MEADLATKSQAARLAPRRRDIAGLPAGVEVLELRGHGDDRGMFTELFRDEWGLGVDLVQWNAVRSEAGVLRGVHVHLVHDDYLTIQWGSAAIGLRDLRAETETPAATATVELEAENPAAIRIPAGVGHGFLFLEPSLHVYAVSHTWDPADELLLRWDDPAIGIDWPREPERLSNRDATAPDLGEVLEAAGLPPLLIRA